jgi:hypothetical protein
MVPLASLWLPILLSAIIVFVASSVLHMVLKYHRTDWAKLPNEDAVMNALRSVPVGDYMMPYSSGPAQTKTPEWQEKMKRGPMAVITVMSGDMQTAFKKALGLWFVYAIVVAIFAAYIAGRTHGPGTPYLEVFRIVGTVAFIGYAMGLWQHSIWYGRKWSTTIKSSMDGLIYGLLTAGTFGWLWPR